MKHKLQNRVRWRINAKIINKLNQLILSDLNYGGKVRYLQDILLKEIINEINEK
jgi:hypothetical protein